MPLQVRVSFRHVSSTPALRRYAERKLARLARYLRRGGEAHVVLSVAKHRHTAEVTLAAAGDRMAGEAETEDLYSALDLALAKIQRQVTEHKARRRQRRGAGRVAAAPLASPRAIIPSRRVVARRMSLEQAVGELQGGRGDVVVFRNQETGHLSILYRRQGGELEVIEAGGRG